jgi:hypothetical protein
MHMLLLIASLATVTFCFSPALADQKPAPEPVRSSMPAAASTHQSEFMMAPLMSDQERFAFYTQWGLVIFGIFAAITALVVWIFLYTRKEAAEPVADENANAYTVPEQPAANAGKQPEATSQTDVSSQAAAETSPQAASEAPTVAASLAPTSEAAPESPSES